MKKFQFFVFALLVFGTMMSCEEYTNSAEESGITYLPRLTMHGPANITLDCTTTTYNDEGLTAEEGGQEIPVETSVEGKYYHGTSVDGPDVYSIVYSATNKDGIPGAAERTVTWEECNGDLVSSIAGMYTANVVRNGVVSAQYQNLGPIMIKDLGNNQYGISDAIGGYYDFGRGYGFHYAGTGFVVTANDISGNDFTHEQIIGVGDFGGELGMTSFTVDAANKTINFVTEWSFGYTFEVELIQN